MKSKRVIALALLTSGLLIGSTTSALADNTPAPTTSSSTYQAQLDQYKIAMIKYRVALVTNDIAYRAAMEKYWSDWHAVMKTYEANWQATMASFLTAKVAYEAKVDVIRAAQKSAFEVAGTAFLSATAGTPSIAALDAALTAYANATKVANATFKSAMTALGAGPVHPDKPAAPVKPIAPVKPVDPTKPIAPEKPKK